MSRIGALAAALILAFTCHAQPGATQPGAMMNTRDANDLYARSLQLMEAATVAIPELGRAGAPMIENARHAATNLKIRPGNLQNTYAFLTNERAFALLADSVPHPYPFPAEADRQLRELRDVIARTEVHFRALIQSRDAQLRSPDRDNLRRYAEANTRLAQPRADKPRVVFMGDSITDIWRLNEYFPDQDYINRGISGQITGEMLGRFKADVLDLNPAAVLILGGTNDLARGISPVAIENNYLMMADLADRHGIKVIFASVTPVSDYHKDQNPSYERSKERPPLLIRALNDWLKSFCQQRNYVYLDYYSAVVDDSGMLKTDLADDGLHPNSSGYRLMAPLAQTAISQALAPTSPQQKPKKHRLMRLGN